jgi:glutathione S-transferase
MPGFPVLYSFRRCPYAIRARLALLLSGLRIALREVELRNKPAEMLALSPKGTVPVLQLVDGTVLEESLDIMLWATQQSASDTLWQSLGEQDKAACLALIDENDQSFKYWLDRYKYAVGYPEQPQQEYRDKGAKFLHQLEKRLARRAYLLANRCTLVDVAVFPFVRQFAFVDKAWFDDSEFTHLQRWLSGFLDSKPFEVAMIKQPPWRPGDDEVSLGHINRKGH